LTSHLTETTFSCIGFQITCAFIIEVGHFVRILTFFSQSFSSPNKTPFQHFCLLTDVFFTYIGYITSNGKMSANDELKRMRKEVAISYFNGLPYHLSEKTT